MLIAVIKLNCTDRYSTILLNLRQFSILNFSMSYTKNEIAKYVCRVVCLIALKRMRKIKNSGCSNKVFLIHGFSGTTTDMIQKAGVSKATMYGCFKIKKRCLLRSLNVNVPTCKNKLCRSRQKPKFTFSLNRNWENLSVLYLIAFRFGFLESVLQRL